MSVRIDENTDHMKYTDDMEAIDSDIMDRVIAEMNSYDADNSSGSFHDHVVS